MEIRINGEPVQVDGPCTVAAIVEQRTGQRAPMGIAVARNGAVVPRSQWFDVQVQEDDELELVGVMQGG
ncbi:MAG: sulfur carrier protein ThiS [Deltaproteobacteria bacterium]|nr:MAG: sulfur carrier protein ThiS [Deltaproteobacteria bacterium]